VEPLGAAVCGVFVPALFQVSRDRPTRTRIQAFPLAPTPTGNGLVTQADLASGIVGAHLPRRLHEGLYQVLILLS